MTKIVINDCYGGFGLSHEAMMKYSEYRGLGLEAADGIYRDSEGEYFVDHDILRDDPVLVRIVEEMADASGPYSNLRIVEIPDGVEWQIEEYDGQEWIAEKHRIWR